MANSYLNLNTEGYYFGLEKDLVSDALTDVQNGSLFHAMDTSQDYRYDEETGEWKLQESNRWWMDR